MSTKSDILRSALKNDFTNANIEIQEDGDKFTIRIESSVFKGMPVVQQHRMVYKSLSSSKVTFHAVQINTICK